MFIRFCGGSWGCGEYSRGSDRTKAIARVEDFR